MAYTDIRTIAADLRVTDKDKGSFLTVDDNCNIVWTNSRVTSSGGVWEYNFVEEDSYIILPQAKLNVGLCIAIMRGKVPHTKDTGDIGPTGTVAQLANSKIVILPYNSGTRENPIYDNIMGGPNFYCSDGVYWSPGSEPPSYAITNLEHGDFSSVIFKSVYAGDGQYTWTIINGVGTWNAEDLTVYPEAYYGAISQFKEFKVNLQTASVNSLSAGMESTDTEFSPLLTISENGLISKQLNESTSLNTCQIIPQNNETNAAGLYYKSNSYVIGRFTDDFAGKFNEMYSEFENSAVNIFGPLVASNWNKDGSLRINQIDKSINYLGYVFDDSSDKEKWWSSLKNKSFSRRLGLRHKGTMTESFIKTLGVAQVIVNINFSKMALKNQKDISNIRSLYCLIQSFFEISSNYIMPYTNVFKVRGNVYSADNDNLIDNQIISLTSSGLGETNSDSGYGSLIQIPITKEDIDLGSINLVFEFMYRPDVSVSAAEQAKTMEEFASLNNKSNQYCLINFIGVEQLKSTSISPEVLFDQIGMYRLSNKGKIINAEGTGHDLINNAFLDYSSTSDINSELYTGLVLRDNYYTSIGYVETETSFFDSYKRYYPIDKISNTIDKNVTKTIIEYDTGITEVDKDQGAMKARLVIDWTDRSWQFTGTLKLNSIEYIASQTSKFSEKPASINYYQRADTPEYILVDALHIQYDGLYRLPWFVHNIIDNEAEASIIITHYKTVTHESGVIETLMNYRCGWERAENEWSIKAFPDGSEYDGLLANYSTVDGTMTSPSKLCITPCHAMQIQSTSTMRTFSLDGSIDNSSRPKRSLLPYLPDSESGNTSIRYFSTNWYDKNLSYGENSGPPLCANDFCELTFSPKSTGSLHCMVELPIETGAGTATGYLVVREDRLTGENEYGDYLMVKDSGTNINATQSPGYSTLKINFIDSVIENHDYRYTLIIYDTIMYASNSYTANHNILTPAINSAICRKRSFGDNNKFPYAGINDFRGLFSLSKSGPYLIPRDSESRDLYQVFKNTTKMQNRIDEDYYINEGVDIGSNFSIEKFKNSFFETSNDYVSNTKSSNIGATFSFYAYVIKEII